MSTQFSVPDAARQLLRHAVATLAYRAEENYLVAEIPAGRVGSDQAAPKRKF